MFSDDRTFSFKQHSHLCLRKPHGLVFYTNLQPYFALRLVKYDFALIFSHSLSYGTHAPCGPLSGDMGKVGNSDKKAE